MIMRGAYAESSGLGLAMVCSIMSKTCSLASLALLSASSMVARSSPDILTSIWKAVMPSRVPVTLKSMSPI